MEDLYALIRHRNSVETRPFESIHASNAHLRSLAEASVRRCESLGRRRLLSLGSDGGDDDGSIGGGSVTTSQSPSKRSVVRAEREANRWKEKASRLQEELNEKLREEVRTSTAALESAKELLKLKTADAARESAASNLRAENERSERAVARLTSELAEALSRARLSEAQFDGLKEALRTLQIENDATSALNRRLLDTAVAEKEKMMEQFNLMNESNERLRKEVSMLRSYNKMEKGWFGKPRGGKGLFAGLGRGDGDDDEVVAEEGGEEGRKWGSIGAAVAPTQPQHTIRAHLKGDACIRYDGANANLVATASTDSTVKVWDTCNGQLKASMSGGGSLPMLGVDIAGGLVCGCGADKTCRVWKYETKRMIHQLAGHSQKITCVRLFCAEKNVLTCSADRSIRIWDISRSIYKQTTTFRHGSTANCADVSPGTGNTIVTGHLDGGVRLWDPRTEDRALDVPSLHDGGVTSVEWRPGSAHEILTGGRDSVLNLIDARTRATLQTFRDPELRSVANRGTSAFSPGGTYVASGSGGNGDIVIWRTADGGLERRLSGVHKHGITGLAWGAGGSNGQQFATIDKESLILWL